MKILLLSDIHGNLNALNAVLEKASVYNIDGCVIAGDLIDYGMHSNEVIDIFRHLKYPILCNVYGNHEAAILNDDYARFSSDRGRDCARYTKSKLNDSSLEFIKSSMLASGKCEIDLDGKKCLVVHGSLSDVYWKSIAPSDDLSEYSRYDYVFSGHSHLPHFFERYYAADAPTARNKKKTVFVNPGSVGQPRNINNRAQFAVIDCKTENIVFEKVEYDIEGEQQAYDGQVDQFYKNRLKQGV